MTVRGNLLIYNRDGYLHVVAQNCGNAATLTHNVFSTQGEAQTSKQHDDNTRYGHGVTLGNGTPEQPASGILRLPIGGDYGLGGYYGGSITKIVPGHWLRVGLRYTAWKEVQIPREDDPPIILPYTELNYTQPQAKGAPVPLHAGTSASNNILATALALHAAATDGVLIQGQLRIRPKADPQGWTGLGPRPSEEGGLCPTADPQGWTGLGPRPSGEGGLCPTGDPQDRHQRLLGWEVWFENTAVPNNPGKLKTGFCGTIVLLNEAGNGEKNAGVGLEAMACPEGGYSAMQFIHFNGDYGDKGFGVRGLPGTRLRAGIRGYSTFQTRLPHLHEGERVYPLTQFKKDAAIIEDQFFDKEALLEKMGEKKGKVRFFRNGANINHELPDTIYRGAEAFQRANFLPPRVTVEWVEDNKRHVGGGWKVVLKNRLPQDEVNGDDDRCADELGGLAFTATLKLAEDGKDFAKLPVHRFSTPGEEKEWFIPLGMELNGVEAVEGEILQIGTRGMGWLGAIPLPRKGQKIDSAENRETEQRIWELWESEYDRGRLYPEG